MRVILAIFGMCALTTFSSCSSSTHEEPSDDVLDLPPPKKESHMEHAEKPLDKVHTPQEQLDYIDDQIGDLKDERDRYLAKAERAQNQGDRIQFQPGQLSEAKRYWRIAEAAREIAYKINQQVSALVKQRRALLKQYPELKST